MGKTDAHETDGGVLSDGTPVVEANDAGTVKPGPAEVAGADVVAPAAAEHVDGDGDGLEPGQTTADNLGDVLGL